MRSETERQMVCRLKSDGKGFNEISDLVNLSRNVVINMHYYNTQLLKKKRGPKFKLTSYEKLRIKRQVAKCKAAQEKVNASKIKISCYLDISTRSIERHFKDIGYKYSRAKKEIVLSKKHKE